MTRTRWLIFSISDDDIRHRLRALGKQEPHAFMPLDVKFISLGDRAAEIQLADGRRIQFPTRALRNNMGVINFSKEALRQRGLIHG